MLPQITQVQWCEARLFTDFLYTRPGGRFAVLALKPVPWKRLPIVGLAKVTQEEEVKDGVRTHTLTLSVTLCKRVEACGFTTPHIAYKLTAADGTEWVMGTDEAPYPLTTFSTSLSDRAGGEQRTQLEAKLTGPLPLMRYMERWSPADENGN